MVYLNEALKTLLAERGTFFWTIPNVYSRAECQHLVERIDAAGPTLAPITTGRGPVMRTDIRTNVLFILH